MPDCGRLAAAIALAEDDIIDPSRIDPAAFDQRLEDHCAQLASIERGKSAEELANGRAQG